MTKLIRAGTRISLRACNSKSLNSAISKRVNNVAGRNLAHRFIERIDLIISLAPRTPDILTKELLLESLLVIDHQKFIWFLFNDQSEKRYNNEQFQPGDFFISAAPQDASLFLPQSLLPFCFL